MKVSVIIPVYNTEQYLRECIESVLAQTYSDLDIVIVDDGSTDSSGTICDEYAARDTRICVVHQQNRGVSAARNVALAHAKGDYITFVDSDDTLHPRMIALLLSLLSKENAVASFAKCIQTDSNEMSISGNTVVYKPQQAIEATLYQQGLDCSLCGKLFPAEAAKCVIQREGMRYEDLDAFYRIYEKIQGNIAVTDAPLYYYRNNPASFINNFTASRLDVLQVTADIERHYADNPVLLRAARDRRFSANYNMFILAREAQLSDVASGCWSIIKSYRAAELFNPRVRLKNRLGALLSYAGPKAVSCVAKKLKKAP